MATSPEHIVNMALRRIGYPTPVGYLLEGSPAARVAVELYGQTRDDLMRAGDFDFARQSAVLVLLKTSPVGGYGWANPWSSAFPPVPWNFEYSYPTGCLMVRSVRPTPTLLNVYDPQPNIFTLADDPSVTPSKVILSNLAGAVAVFTGQITDPALWNASFTEALVAALATRLQAALNPEPNAEKERVQEEVQTAGMAIARPG